MTPQSCIRVCEKSEKDINTPSRAMERRVYACFVSQLIRSRLLMQSKLNGSRSGGMNPVASCTAFSNHTSIQLYAPTCAHTHTHTNTNKTHAHIYVSSPDVHGLLSKLNHSTSRSGHDQVCTNLLTCWKRFCMYLLWAVMTFSLQLLGHSCHLKYSIFSIYVWNALFLELFPHLYLQSCVIYVEPGCMSMHSHYSFCVNVFYVRHDETTRSLFLLWFVLFVLKHVKLQRSRNLSPLAVWFCGQWVKAPFLCQGI